MKRSINIEVKDYKILNKMRVELTNKDPKGKMVTFAEVISQLLADAGE